MSGEAAAFRVSLEAIDRVLGSGGDADEALREVVSILHERAGYEWAAIRFVEGDDLALGPSAGEPGEDAIGVPVRYETREIAVLEVAPGRAEDEQAPFLEQVAARISLQCLVGWDTGGERWEP